MNTVEKSIRVFLCNAEQTRALGATLADIAVPRMVIALSGDLGTGKSTFVAGFAKRLGSSSYAASPTYNLLHIHDTEPPIYHFDVYRMKDSYEFEEMGGEEYIYGDGIAIVEWAEKIEEYLPLDSISIKMSHSDSGRLAIVAFSALFSPEITLFLQKLEKLGITCTIS